jgi:molybdate transport system substrate-binding protein
MPIKPRSWQGLAWLALVFNILSASPCLAENITIAVASNFSGTLKQLLKSYDKVDDNIIIVSGATGKLSAQIMEGAPFDVLLAADDRAPGLLAREGLAVGESEFTYATGKLALWSADSNLISANGAEVLKNGKFDKLAYANPKVAPYGLAAEATLMALGLFDRLNYKVVTGENVGQAFAMVASGSAELGFVALAQVLGSQDGRKGSWWEVPDHLHPPVRQNAILLTRAKDIPAASAFLEFLKSNAGLEIIRAAGYATSG